MANLELTYHHHTNYNIMVLILIGLHVIMRFSKKRRKEDLFLTGLLGSKHETRDFQGYLKSLKKLLILIFNVCVQTQIK